MILKICGLSDPENIREVSSLHPDMMGFIFYAPSPRNACALLHREVRNLPEDIDRVGVFVDAPVSHVLHLAEKYALTTIQLHGHESPAMCDEIRSNGYRVMKALGINRDTDWEEYRCYEGHTDLFILDTLTAMHGGSGRKFNWSLLRDYPLQSPFLLSGGIGPDDARAAMEAEASMTLMTGIDINSRFETSPGHKNITLLKQFINELKR